MTRKSACLSMLLLCVLAVFGCRTSPQASDYPPGCVEDKSSPVVIAVFDDASADPECVIVKKGNANILWRADPAVVRTVKIKFDRVTNPNAPDDPLCAGAECILEKAKHAQKQGTFAYFVWVENQDGSTAGTDPVLIIKP